MLFIASFDFPVAEYMAKEWMGPRIGASSMAPIIIATLFKNRPVSAISPAIVVRRRVQ